MQIPRVRGGCLWQKLTAALESNITVFKYHGTLLTLKSLYMVLSVYKVRGELVKNHHHSFKTLKYMNINTS